MSAQTSYTLYTQARIHGQLTDLRNSEIVSRIAETTDIGFGLVVSRGTDKAKQAILGGVAPIGITVRDISLQNDTIAQAELKYVVEDPMSILRRGPIAVTCAAGCVPGDAVKYTTATGVINAGAPGAGEAALLGVEWDSVAAAGEIAVLRLTGEALV